MDVVSILWKRCTGTAGTAAALIKQVSWLSDDKVQPACCGCSGRRAVWRPELHTREKFQHLSGARLPWMRLWNASSWKEDSMR